MALIRGDGCWTWFNDARGYYSSVHNAIYLGSIGTTGDIKAYKYDVAEQTLQAIKLRLALEIDDHDNPSFLVLDAAGPNPGKVLVGYSKHTGPSYRMITSVAGDIRTWGTEANIGAGESYVQLYQLANTARTVYWIYRNGTVAGSYNWSFRTSTDGGSTWAAGVALLNVADFGDAYIRSFQNGASRIDFLVTKSRPGAGGSNSIYHFYLTVAADGTRSFFKTDGTSIGGDGALPFAITNLTLVETNATGSWIWDGNAYSGVPYGVYARFASSDTVHTYWRCNGTGGTWATEQICNAGDVTPNYLYAGQTGYSPGVALDPGDADTVYVSRKYGASDFRIEKWQRSGGTWAKTTDITGAAGAVNARPIFVRGSGAASRCLFWGGTYTTFNSFSTSLYAEPGLDFQGPAKPAVPVWRPALAPHASAIQAYYLLHEGIGTTYADRVATANGVTAGTLTWGSGTYGPQLSGFSASNYATMDALAALFQAGTLPRFLAVLFRNTDAATYGWAFSFGRSSSANPWFGVGVNFNSVANQIFGSSRNDANTVEAGTAVVKPAASDGNYHVLMFVETATNSRQLYFDGAVASTPNVSTVGTQTLNQATMGALRRTTVAQPFPGTIAAVMAGWNGYPDPYLLYDDWMNGQFAGTRDTPPVSPAAGGGFGLIGPGLCS